MVICVECGCEFDISSARRIIGGKYGAGIYNEYFPDNDICADCASLELRSDIAAGLELQELMGTG